MERICLLPEHVRIDLVKYVHILFRFFFIYIILFYKTVSSDMLYGCWSVLMIQVDVMPLCFLVTVFILGLFKKYLIAMMDYVNSLML